MGQLFAPRKLPKKKKICGKWGYPFYLYHMKLHRIISEYFPLQIQKGQRCSYHIILHFPEANNNLKGFKLP